MIFTVRDLGFEIGPFLLEGWWALAARAVCAAVIAGLLVGWLLRRKIFPALQARSWHFAATPILLRSLQSPLARMAFYSGLYLALTSLPWAIPGLTKFLFTAYKIVTTLLFCQGLYNASEVADLLLASCSPEIRSNKTLRSLLDTTYKVLVIILGVATCAQIVGFPIGSIVAGAGLVGLTISLAAQESASNLFSGIVILLDKPFSIGDWITVGNVEGEVIDINFRSTRIRTFPNALVIVPNSSLVSSPITNWSRMNKRRATFSIGLTYDTPKEKMEECVARITEMVNSNEEILANDTVIRFNSFQDSSLEISLMYFTKPTSFSDFQRIKEQVNYGIMQIVEDLGLSFAFPTQTLYVHPDK